MNLKKRFSSINENFRMLHTDDTLIPVMSEKVISWLPDFPREYVIVCIGTDRSTGDALGPLTGTLFSEMKPKHMTVYGTLHKPVHATNLNEYTDIIKSNHSNPFIIAIDACLGKTTSVGHLIAGAGPLKPGAALNKPLPSIGNIHITGVVNISGFMEYSVLQNTRLSVVVDMAQKIAELLDIIDQRLKYNYSSPAILLKQEKQQKI
ncbi:spore protease YyaC [Virgibacillus profundi]|uniref:Spore protease YyaC n=1 Tax=Virgibacillus profundi TaxID=2024555 RepID=A0A2A2I8Z7_9BACI|nr:spore protease YyaC [Virgibacillus profundi]PAV28481.1 spore protease YyaC [Virgibacillus profundi]PXY52654.1 spore protease YyaC [Virgibacillus profundi]